MSAVSATRPNRESWLNEVALRPAFARLGAQGVAACLDGRQTFPFRICLT